MPEAGDILCNQPGRELPRKGGKGEAAAAVAKLQTLRPLVQQQADTRRQVTEMPIGRHVAWFAVEKVAGRASARVGRCPVKREEADAARAILQRQHKTNEARQMRFARSKRTARRLPHAGSPRSGRNSKIINSGNIN
jgi:hypothetical protein